MRFKTMIFTFLFFAVSGFAVNSSYLSRLNRKDINLMRKAGIEIKEKFRNIPINWEMGEVKLFELGKRLLDTKHDVFNAYKVFNYLALNYKKDQYMLYLGKCYFFMGELYYKGYIKTYYKKAYDIFERLTDKDDENYQYLKWHSFAAAKVGGFIRHKNRGTFSGLSYLRESVSLNDDILDDVNSKDESALLTEGEYQIETDSIPVFGGSEKKGVKIFRKVLKMYPNSLRGNLLMGKYLYKKKRKYKQALNYLLKAAKLYDSGKTPRDMEHYYMRIFLEMHLIRTYSRLNQQDKVFKHIKKHLALLPRSPSGLGALVSYLVHVKKDKANACLVAKRLVQMDPYGRKKKKMQSVCK